jgi:hypothetical protein
VAEDGEGHGGGDEPPARPRQGTSDAARPRNLRRGQAEEPPTKKRRRIGGRAEDSSLRQAEALGEERVQGS